MPIPTWGTPAAITALPQPPKVNQKVPIASAANCLLLPFIKSSQCFCHFSIR
jgi:hypothetical protein